jgi:hypothetical protein
MADHAPLPGRRSWYGFCACRECGNRANKRRTKRAEDRQVQRAIERALIESEHDNATAY